MIPTSRIAAHPWAHNLNVGLQVVIRVTELIRHVDNRVELRDCMDDFIGVVPEPEHEYILQEDTIYLQRLIDMLPIERDREILLRHYLQDQSKFDICDELSLSGENYDRVISRARIRLIKSGSQYQ